MNTWPAHNDRNKLIIDSELLRADQSSFPPQQPGERHHCQDYGEHRPNNAHQAVTQRGEYHPAAQASNGGCQPNQQVVEALRPGTLGRQ